MKKNLAKFAVAGLLLAGVSNVNAITLTDGGASIDFDPTTTTFNNWIVAGVNQLTGGQVAYNGGNGFLLGGETAIGTNSVLYTLGTPNAMTGDVLIVFTGSASSSSVSYQYNSFTPIDTIAQTTAFTLGGDNTDDILTANATGDVAGGDPMWTLGQISTTVNGTTVFSTSAGGTYAFVWDYADQPGILNTTITLEQTQSGNVIPEPLTASLGLASVGLLGLRLTGRRSR